MISAKIQATYQHQHLKLVVFNGHIYVADYTEQTKADSVKRAVEFFSPLPPSDISYFTITNDPSLNVAGIDFDNDSFVCDNGNSRTQCESVFFPKTSTNISWILFCELKYSSRPLNNENNLRKAISQLYRTRYYYYQSGIFLDTNTSYLIASLPLQSEPFANFVISQPSLTNLKRSRNIVLRFKNNVKIQNSEIVIV